MPKPRSETGDKNLISGHLKALRKEHHMSQRELANQLQLLGVDMDKNVITRIETNKRYVTDIEPVSYTHLGRIGTTGTCRQSVS